MDINAAFKITASASGMDQIERLNRSIGQTSLAQDSATAAGQRLLQSLREQVAAASLGQAEYTKYQASLLGVSKEAKPLIATLETLKTETATKAKADAEAAAAARALAAAEASAAASRQKFLQSLNEQIATQGKSQLQMLEYQASLLGISKEATPLIATLDRLKTETAAKAKADADAALAAKNAAAADAAAAASRQRFMDTLQEQVAIQGKTHAQILEYRAAQLGLSKEAAPLIAKLGETNRALHGTGVSAGQTAQAMRQLPAQFNDVVVSLAGGQNPLLVMLQQGSQVVDSFGGVGNAGRALLTIFTPLRIAVGGVASVFALLGVAAYQADSDMENMRRSILMTGNYAGVTRDRINEMAEAVKNTAGLTVGQSKEVVSLAVSSGSFGPETIEPASKAMALFQKVSGEAADTVVKGFASMRKGVSEWANEYASKYALIKAEDLSRIKIIEDTQGKEAAMRETLRLVTEELALRNVEMEKEVGVLSMMYQGWSKLLSLSWNKTKDAFSPDTMKEGLDKLQRELKSAEAGLQRLQTSAFVPDNVIESRKKYVESLRDQVEKQREAIATSERLAEAQAKEAEAAKRRAEDMAKMGQYSAAEKDYTTTVQESSSFMKRAVIELQLSALQSSRNRGLMTEAQYAQRAYQEREKMLTLERDEAMQALMRAKYQKDAAAATGDTLTRMKSLTEYEKARTTYNRANLELLKLQEEGNGDTSGAAALAKSNELLRQQAVLRKQLAELNKTGNTPNQSVEASMEFEVNDPLGTMFNIDPAKKQRILELAKAVDELNAAMKAGTASADFDKRTRAIMAEAEAVGLSVEQKSRLVAAQDLESRGVSKTSAEYKKLLAERVAADKFAADRNAAQTFNERTKAIQQETAALGLSARAKEELAAKQELENLKVAEGTQLYQELMAKRLAAINASQQAATSWQTGMQQGVNEYLANAGNAAVQTKELISTTFQAMEDALVNFVMTGKMSFSDFANTVIAEIVRIQIRMMIAKAVTGASGLFSSFFASANGNAFSASGQPVTAFAKGGAFAPAAQAPAASVQAFAQGGAFTNTIATKPTIAPLALFGEAGPEAIMPLDSAGGKLGVRMLSRDGGEIVLPLIRDGAGRLAVTEPTEQDSGGKVLPFAKPASQQAFANGGAFAGGQAVQAFAQGGSFTNTVADKPTTAPLALFGEAGPEAIMPLEKQGGALGVRMLGRDGTATVLPLARDGSGRLAVSEPAKTQEKAATVVQFPAPAAAAAGIAGGQAQAAQAFAGTGQQAQAPDVKLYANGGQVTTSNTVNQSSSSVGGQVQQFARGGAFTSSSVVNNVRKFANGGAFSSSSVTNRVHKFAKGGTFTSNTVNEFASGGIVAGTSNILPFVMPSGANSGTQQQQYSGGQAGDTTVSVEVNINMADGTTTATASGAGDVETAKQLGSVVANIVKKQLVEEIRTPGGLLYGARK